MRSFLGEVQYEMFRLAGARFAPVRRPAVARAARVRLLQWGAVALRPDVAVVRVRRELNGGAAAERGIEHAGQHSVQGRGADNVVGSCSRGGDYTLRAGRLTDASADPGVRTIHLHAYICACTQGRRQLRRHLAASHVGCKW